MKRSFRDSASFGKRVEYKIIGDMLMEGLDCYLPLVDDHGVDCVIKRKDGVFLEIQIKARSKNAKYVAFFAAIEHIYTPNFYFVFYSEKLETMWILSSEEFLKECVTNKTGKNAGKHSVSLQSKRFDRYIHNDFSIFHTPAAAEE